MGWDEALRLYTKVFPVKTPIKLHPIFREHLLYEVKWPSWRKGGRQLALVEHNLLDQVCYCDFGRLPREHAAGELRGHGWAILLIMLMLLMSARDHADMFAGSENGCKTLGENSMN